MLPKELESMKKVTFENIHRYGQLVIENEIFKHIHNPDMLLQYDSNFITFKKMPSIDQFIESKDYLRTFHERYGQKHLRFYFPENEKLTSSLSDYLKAEKFGVGFLELYAVQPTEFPDVKDHTDIVVQQVSDETLDVYLDFQYQLDSIYGHAFAEQKQSQHVRNFKDASKMQLIAFYKGCAAGSVDVMISADTAEIDGLMVLEDYQKKGIGSRLQKYVMDQFYEKTVILVADGEDTPKEMYRKQNYQYLGFQFDSMKVYE